MGTYSMRNKHHFFPDFQEGLRGLLKKQLAVYPTSREKSHVGKLYTKIIVLHVQGPPPEKCQPLSKQVSQSS
jgi:hypothetical protein